MTLAAKDADRLAAAARVARRRARRMWAGVLHRRFIREGTPVPLEALERALGAPRVGSVESWDDPEGIPIACIPRFRA